MKLAIGLHKHFNAIHHNQEPLIAKKLKGQLGSLGLFNW
jgi:hypothetical protein